MFDLVALRELVREMAQAHDGRAQLRVECVNLPLHALDAHHALGLEAGAPSATSDLIEDAAHVTVILPISYCDGELNLRLTSHGKQTVTKVTPGVLQSGTSASVVCHATSVADSGQA